ncbi:peptidoglycan DD-metalloendopeptidase family protein [uncultured Algibacter sp.]|uniref:peptidoglycan DD-metalloendopeptidase family protein n=1 Tax=uncultured Algibacter sp. TaxID=298659 RepID=UPI0026144EE5|nr:peptidoglycan DD-metalloendopeptidase family protein [uncultured Algibacter sp.]
MKSKIILFLILSILLMSSGNAQTPNFTPDGGEFAFNAKNIPCLTDKQREGVLNDIRNNIQQLKLQKKLSYSKNNVVPHPLFIWPVKKKDGHEYNDVWGISNYVDQNAAYPNQIQDYNCGTRTYDTTSGYNHAGIDIFNWPFQWKMMDNDEVEIVAAAPGQILAKVDSRTDRSCSLNGTNWNFVYVQHADGSVAVYGHLKQFSSTTKVAGDMVEEGEYLGVVGSSGNSTGPHLHFEVYSEIEWNGVGQDVLVDPYAGTCNSMNSDTWWQNQKPYNNPNINAALTHSAPPVFPACPTQETTNESNDFLTTDTIYFAIYLRDQEVGTTINLKILRPNNTALYSWDFALNANYNSSYWYWNYTGAANIPGEWKWQATYNGQTVTHPFNVTNALSVEDNFLKNTSIFPNPTNDLINISSIKKISKAEIINVTGKSIKYIHQPTQGIKTINTSNLSNGLYFLMLESDAYEKKIIKFIKE